MFLIQLQGGPFNNQNVLVPTLNPHVYFFRCSCKKWYQYAISTKIANAISEEAKGTKARTQKKGTGQLKKPQAVYAWYKAAPAKETTRYKELLTEPDQHQPFYENTSSNILDTYLTAWERDHPDIPLETLHLPCRNHLTS